MPGEPLNAAIAETNGSGSALEQFKKDLRIKEDPILGVLDVEYYDKIKEKDEEGGIYFSKEIMDAFSKKNTDEVRLREMDDMEETINEERKTLEEKGEKIDLEKLIMKHTAVLPELEKLCRDKIGEIKKKFNLKDPIEKSAPEPSSLIPLKNVPAVPENSPKPEQTKKDKKYNSGRPKKELDIALDTIDTIKRAKKVRIQRGEGVDRIDVRNYKGTRDENTLYKEELLKPEELGIIQEKIDSSNAELKKTFKKTAEVPNSSFQKPIAETATKNTKEDWKLKNKNKFEKKPEVKQIKKEDEIEALKKRIDELNKQEQESYKMENYKVKDQRFGTIKPNREREVLELEKKIHKLERIKNKGSIKPKQEGAEDDLPEEKKFWEEEGKDIWAEGKTGQEQAQWEKGRMETPPSPEKEAEINQAEKLEKELAEVRMAYARGDYKMASSLSGIKKIFGTWIKTKTEDISEVNEAYQSYKNKLAELLQFKLEEIEKKNLAADELKKEMGYLIKYFNQNEKNKLYECRLSAEVDSKKGILGERGTRIAQKIIGWDMCLNLQKAETSEALKNVLAEQAAQAAAAETGDKNTIDNVQKNALDIIKKVSGRKWDAWLSMKPMTISQAKKEFGRKFQNDLNAVIEEYSRSIGASEAKLKYNETLGQWMARLSKLAGKNGQ